MSKQEKIKEEIKTILKERYGENWIHSKVALQIIHTLHSQGAVLKVDKELPNDEWLANLKKLIDPGSYYYFKKWTAVDRGKTVGERQVTSYLAQGGYVAVEPLVRTEESIYTRAEIKIEDDVGGIGNIEGRAIKKLAKKEVTKNEEI